MIDTDDPRTGYAQMVLIATDLLEDLQNTGLDPRFAAGVLAVGIAMMVKTEEQARELVSAAYDDMNLMLKEAEKFQTKKEEKVTN